MSAFRSSLWGAFAFQANLLFGVWATGDIITSSEAQKVGTVLFFGDSYVDPGNNNHIPTLIKSNFRPYGGNFVERNPTGRFSDGKILPDYLAAGLGIKELLPAYLDPSLQEQDLITGVSFASSGSGLDNLTAATLELYNLDLSRIGTINLPPLGCLPFEKTLRIKVGGECAEEVNEAAAEFNAKLISTIDGLKSKLPGVKIVSLNYYDIVLGAIKDPGKYGFEVTGRACCGTGSIEFGYLCNSATPFTCSDASKYVFFDSIQLTQKSYGIISEAFLSQGVSQLL